jgi:hypothetical protein
MAACASRRTTYVTEMKEKGGLEDPPQQSHDPHVYQRNRVPKVKPLA